jgi:CelD/BcsL family acetyltransferase involved in cellulose biosynthesis
MSMLTVDDLRGDDAWASIRTAWNELFAASTEPSPFLGWEWLSVWKRHFAPHEVIRILVARQAGQIVGALALVDERIRIAQISTPLRRLSFLGAHHGGPDYLDVIARAGREQDAAKALIDHLARSGGFDICDLDGIASDSVSLPLLTRQFGEESEYALSITPRYVCPRILLDAPWADVLARSKRTENYTRRLRQARSRPGFDWREIRDANEAPAAFERFVTLHQRRWSKEGGSDAMGRPSVRAFHRDVVIALADAGRLRFEELWVEGSCRASIYGIDAGDTYAYYQCGYDPEWSSHSVGLVALGLSIEAAIARGAHVYEFLHGEEPYKYDWTSATRETTAVRLVRRSFPVSALLAREQVVSGMRATAHALLPVSSVERIRRLRRGLDERA